jgi:hypothetical protein
MDDLSGQFRLYLDETGTHHLPRNRSPDHERYLGLLGCIINCETYRSRFIPAMNTLKRRTFGEDPDSPVVLHREDILQRRDEFSVLENEEVRRRFNADVVGLYGTQDYALIAVVLDKKTHTERYGKRAYRPYDYCFTLMAERFCYFLNRRHGAVGEIVAESRGKREDGELMEAWNKFYAKGTWYAKTATIHQCLASDALIFRKKHQNIAGLQLADLLAYDATREVLIENERKRDEPSGMYPHVKAAVASKWDRCHKSGRVTGYGRVLIK